MRKIFMAAGCVLLTWALVSCDQAAQPVPRISVSERPTTDWGLRSRQATTLADAKALAPLMVADSLPFFRERALRNDPLWSAEARTLRVAQLMPGRYRVDYAITVTTTLEPRLMQSLSGQFEIGPKAEVRYGGPEDWCLLYKLADLSDTQASALLRYAADAGNPTIENLTRLDDRQAVGSSFGAKYADGLIAYGRGKGYRRDELLFTLMSDEERPGSDHFHLLGWDAARSEWELLKTVSLEDVPW